jgi:hypothetical protein
MLRRISLIVASAAMAALSVFSALPASATTQSSAATQSTTTHKLFFHDVHGISAWGSYIKTSKFIRITVCAVDTAPSNFAVGAVAVGTNANGKLHSNLGAVAIGYKQGVCRSGLIRYTSHLYTYTFIATSKGTIAKRSASWKFF